MEALLDIGVEVERPEIRHNSEGTLIEVLDGSGKSEGYVTIYLAALRLDKPEIIRIVEQAAINLSKRRANEFIRYFRQRIGIA